MKGAFDVAIDPHLLKIALVMKAVRYLIVAATFLVFSLNAAEPVKSPVLIIGVDAPLTGNEANVGEESMKGITLALEEFKGKNPVGLKFIYEDNELQNRQTNSAALKLIQFNHVDGLITVWTDAAYIVAPIAEKYQVIHFNTGWDTGPSSNKWTLVCGGDLREFARQSVEIMKHYKVKRLAITGVVESGVINVIKAAQPYFKEAGITVVFDEPYTPGTRDFRTYVLKLRETKPDFAWNLNHAPEDEILFKAEAELGINIPSSGFYFYNSPELYRHVEGAVFPRIAATSDFDRKFEVRFGRKPKLIEAAYCYDMTYIFSDAVNNLYAKLGRMPTRAELLSEMKRPRPLPNLAEGSGKISLPGYVDVPYVLRQIRNGQQVPWSF